MNLDWIKRWVRENFLNKNGDQALDGRLVGKTLTASAPDWTHGVGGSQGSVSLVRGAGPPANHPGYVEWRKPDNTRQAYMGYDADNLRLQLENNHNLCIIGNVGIGTTTPSQLLVVGEDIGAYSGNRITVGNTAGPSAINLGESADNRFFLHYDQNNKHVTLGHRLAGSQTNTLVLKGPRVGLHVVSPAGTLHAHDGVGGMIFWTHTAVGATAAVIVPNGTGDVLYQCQVWGVIRAGTASGALEAVLAPGESRDCTLASGTWRVRVTSAGQLEILRTAGSVTAQVALLALWL